MSLFAPLKVATEIIYFVAVLTILIAAFLIVSIAQAFFAYLQIRICLLITYIFTLYLGFMFYWAEIIQHARDLTPFFLYTASGMIIVVLFILESFKSRPTPEQRHSLP